MALSARRPLSTSPLLKLALRDLRSFFSGRRVSLCQRTLAFAAVVNEALLAALEVRPLSQSDTNKLEQARGLILRRLFGREGFGAGDPQHRSVTIQDLRRRARLATVSSELGVRRLLWLRASLLAEARGQQRLELATLFGDSPALGACVTADSGVPTTLGPRFLHLLHHDLLALGAGFTGFCGSWKQAFLSGSVAVANIRHLHSPETEAAPIAAEPVQEPQQQEFAGLAAGIFCARCNAGPWKNRRALQSHLTHRHMVRHAVQQNACPLCSRRFTTKTAAQRHFDKASCGSVARNHGHAGALHGQHQSEAALAQAPAARPAI